MNIQLITERKTWNEFFERVGSPSFHQAWEWGEFQKLLGYDIERIGLYDQKDLQAIALVIKIRSKRGNFLFIPHGPLFDIPTDRLTMTVPETQKERVHQQLLHIRSYLTDLAQKEGFWFIRIAPILDRTREHTQLFQAAGFRTAPLYIHAETMWVVDISPSEEEIMHNMRKNTRYYIRKAEREGITVTKHDSLDAIEDFWRLYEATAEREQFTPYSKSYIEHEFQAFHDSKQALFFLGALSDNTKNTIPPKFAQEGASEILAGSLVLFTKSSGFYHQGASLHTKYPVPYRLQWESMLEAKRRGCHYYNFYGIFDPGRTPKAWEGLSLFKRGFGGFQVDYLFTQDYVVSPRYYFSYMVDRYLAWRRGI